MRNATITYPHEPKRGIAAMIGLTTCALLIAAYTRTCRADEPVAGMFPSAAAAANALYRAVRSDDQDALTRILGVGKEAVSSGDPAQDRAERE